VSTVRSETVASACDQSRAVADGAFADVRHADGFINVRTETAENALAEVQSRGALATRVFKADCGGGTNGRGRPGIFPIRLINFRAPADAGRKLHAGFGIGRGDNTGAQTFWKDVKHRSSVCTRIGEIEAFVHDGKIGNDVAQNRFAQRGPILQ